MNVRPDPFIPPAPVPRSRGAVPSALEIIRTAYRNPLELWGEPSYEDRWIKTRFLGMRTVIANDPGLIRHVLVENQKNYRMARVRQAILRPILRDGLLTAEGETWRRSRKAIAPIFTPRHIHGFGEIMLRSCEAFAKRYEAVAETELAQDMTLLTYEILAQTLFTGEIAGDPDAFANEIETLFETMGRVDPMDVIAAPAWVPRITRIRGRKAMQFFRRIVRETMDMRLAALERGEERDDFLTLLLKARGERGITTDEIEDNIITFIGAGHETTARALGWTIYLLAGAPNERDVVEAEIDAFLDDRPGEPATWAEKLPKTLSAFEEALRLYPPAPSINREAVETDRYEDLVIEPGDTLLVMPWTLHRHRALWDQPDAFKPERFWPQNREKIDRYQYLPFGAGPRICIGAGFARQEAVIALAVILSRFRFDILPDCNPWPVQKLTTQPQGGLHMKITRRKEFRC
ncbi:MAG: cytochrome P450 [Nitratireductor sp.]